MAFDDKTRNRLQRLVSDCRSLLADEFSIQIQQTYGLDPNSGEVTPLGRLAHLSDRERHTAQLLRDTLAHYLAGDEDDKAHRIAAIDRIIREQAFTVLNRLAAILMMETRGLLRAAVSQGQQSQAFELYKMIAGNALGETGNAYQVFLFSLFDEFAQDLPALFDRFAPQGQLFPREQALMQLIDALNHHEVSPLWAEDETIGWIYQYFNSKEERKKMREASQAPRNSRELAVRNQFFTPRYVVEFLVDNTLGRLWFNATGGQTGLRERCQYLLVKPDEVLPAAVKLRDPRTLKLLDPACGSMHFGLYAFDLFLEIYREAWDWEQTHGPGSLDLSNRKSDDLRPLCQTYADADAFLRDVPRLIIEHNIHGVDIDPRAAQIASLALWLRAQRAWHEAGTKAMDRPAVGQGHVLAAVAPPAEKELRQRFMAQLDRLDAELFEKTLFMLKGLPELGVLLDVERELPQLIRQVYGEHGRLFKEADTEQWSRAESRLRFGLAQFANASSASYQSHLFKQDALLGLRLIDLFREKFDVVVMNPPFGAPPEGQKNYIFEKYPDEKTEVAACFVSRGLELISQAGYLGAITNRTFVFSETFQRWRSKALGGIECCADLGFGVLDALVETSAYTASKNPDEEAWFFPLINSKNKNEDLRTAIKSAADHKLSQASRAIRSRSAMTDYGTEWFYYWLPEEVLTASPKFQSKRTGMLAKPGLQTCDNFRFLRLYWEIDRNSLVQDAWPRLTKGGEYQPFWSDVRLVMNWRSNGAEMKAFIESSYQSWSKQIPSVNLYTKPGLTYSERTTSSLSLRILPAGCFFDKQGPFIGYMEPSVREYRFLLTFLGISYTYLFRCLTESKVGLRDATEAGSPARHYMPSIIEQLPMFDFNPNQIDQIISWVHACINFHKKMCSIDVTDSHFECFSGIGNFSSLKDFYRSFSEDRAAEMIGIYVGLREVNKLVDQSYGISENSYQQLLDTFGPDVGIMQDVKTEIETQKVEEVLSKPESEIIELVANEVGNYSSIMKQSFVANRKIELASILYGIPPDKLLRQIKSADWVVEKTRIYRNFFDYLVGFAFGRWGQLRQSGSASSSINSREFSVESPFEPIFIPCLKYSSISDISDRGLLENWKGSDFDLISCISKATLRIWHNEGSADAFDRIEKELCETFGYDDLRSYVESPNGFFDHHFTAHSESRRRAPIYWPLSTASGSYTLWLYYPSLTSQTLYTAINDFVEPKLAEVESEAATLRAKGSARSRDEEKRLEALATLEAELRDLRDQLQAVAPQYHPNHDDGVQITAAPLWPLFRHKPWQKVLRDTWTKLEKGDYDWAHLAMTYWPERVREKCRHDKSLAIAHGLEELYVEPPVAPKKARGRKTVGADE